MPQIKFIPPIGGFWFNSEPKRIYPYIELCRVMKIDEYGKICYLISYFNGDKPVIVQLYDSKYHDYTGKQTINTIGN